MDNNAHVSSYGDILNEFKNRIVILKRKCSTEQEKLEKKVLEISRLDKDIGQFERELSEYKTKTLDIYEKWKDREIEIEKLKLMQEKASVISECNRRKHELQSKTMDIIRQNYSNLTVTAFKNVRQETATMIINNELNNLTDRKKELDDKLYQLHKAKNENENYLTQALAELMETKTRGEAVIRLRKKLQESENSRFDAITKLQNLKTSKFMDFEDDFQ